MLLLGHVGITLGAVRLLSKLQARRPLLRRRAARATAAGAAVPAPSNLTNGSSPSSRAGISLQSIDYRLVIIGALLPDIIDKPIGIAFFDNGRIFAHSLLFAIVLLGLGMLVYRWKGRTGLLVLSLCSAGHLILDQMWQNPHTLFWPFLGWGFPDTGAAQWASSLSNWFQVLTADPYVLAGEIIGGLIVLWFAVLLIKHHNVRRFITKGIIE